ncbi:glycoside hydrolase domain-containing protein [Victivallis sp. Marseille-Q1083]|uniref:glycoside hydrolase domain-containing protein n=1 Tax=Victivallis sp. Marseille-Q1083 TaxID=2717288 RepID=UPI00158DF800|nr:glycoside hydrolase domain-containing protein [Victivallis sp. Marseille-Q1083]
MTTTAIRSGLAGLMWLGLNVLTAAPPVYEVADWPESGFGNHRAKLEVDDDAAQAAVVEADIQWRRRDADAADKALLLYAEDGTAVTDLLTLACSDERGVIRFRPAAGAGIYYLYYLPYTRLGLCASEEYYPPRDTARPHWKQIAAAASNPPQARLLALQARHEFNNFYPMEVAATRAETAALAKQCAGRKLVIFPEDRDHAIRMFDRLPLRWIESGPSNRFEGVACPGEYYVFQLGIWAPDTALDQLTADWSGPAAATATCFNLSGSDWLGRPFSRRLQLDAGKVQPLWMGVRVPLDAAGSYTGTVTVSAAGVPPQTVDVALRIAGDPLPDGGIAELRRLARLQWLNSRRGLEAVLPPPYQPVRRSDGRVSLLNRSLHFAASGLPDSLQSNGIELLAAPMRLVAGIAGREVELTGEAPAELLASDDTRLELGNSGKLGDAISVALRSRSEADGCIQFFLDLTADRETRLDNLTLQLPLRRAIARYWMGMEKRGGKRQGALDWQWNGQYLNNLIWVGDVQAGVQLKLQSAEDTWALWALPLDPAMLWAGGGCRSEENGDTLTLLADTGSFTLQPGKSRSLRFRLLLTPFKPIDPRHWQVRISNDSNAVGPRIYHIHHGTRQMPYINYPFTHLEELKTFLAELARPLELDTPEGRQSRPGLEVQLYYTVRELSNHCSELWAFRSFGDEIFTTREGLTYTDMGAFSFAPGGGYPWLQEHLVDHYVPAWRTDWLDAAGLPGDFCAAITTRSDSRLINYYVESLHYLFRETGAQGLYLDGIGFGREVTKRVARTLAKLRPDYRINMHCSDLYPSSKISVMNHAMEHLPYLTDLWLGEFYDYDMPADYYLVEISGIPFGLTNEMLNYETGGNPYRGMVFGMSSRYLPDAESMWKLWDRFGIEKAAMLGYWDNACPVAAAAPGVKVTCYQKADEALIAIARWPDEHFPADEVLPVELSIRPDIFAGFQPEKYELWAPPIKSFQPEAHFSLTDAIPVAPDKGALLWLRRKDR